jgi:hypothetical protein
MNLINKTLEKSMQYVEMAVSKKPTRLLAKSRFILLQNTFDPL